MHRGNFMAFNFFKSKRKKEVIDMNQMIETKKLVDEKKKAEKNRRNIC